MCGWAILRYPSLLDNLRISCLFSIGYMEKTCAKTLLTLDLSAES